MNILQPTDPNEVRRLARIDKFMREQATKNGEQYKGYEYCIDFVIYTIVKVDGTLELRCDNTHLDKEPILTNVRRIDPIEYQYTEMRGYMLHMHKEQMLNQCREAAKARR